jgi:ATP-dependent DNA ligase
MVDVMCPLSFEDLDALLADEQLPSELAAVFEDSARTIEVPGGYERGYEGIVAKDPESPYVPGRTLRWLKVKQKEYRKGERGFYRG